MANVKNYVEQGGGKTVIGGELNVASGGKLKVESGATVEGISGGGGVLIATVDTTTGALDKTWKEIHDSEVPVFVKLDGTAITWDAVYAVGSEDSSYAVITVNDIAYLTDSENGYPALVGGGLPGGGGDAVS